MILQAKKLGGDVANARNIIDTRIVFEEDEQLEKGAYNVVHSIELVKGSTVVHGGGAKAGDFLHYKSLETDVDEDGDIDYSATTIHTEMLFKGFSEIKVVAKVTNLSKVKAFQDAWVEWNDARIAESKRLAEIYGPQELETERELHFWEDDNPMPEDDTFEILKSGNLYLEWARDEDSNWV